ncbi:MAG: MCE family protein [Methylococcaceae bacterium]|nr:MCE family protein [Methylococcaceae bacterium]
MGRNNHALMTGLFLLLLVVGTVAAAYWIGHFERERNIYVISTQESVSGLNPESTVFYRGIAVGKVIKVKFDPHDSGTILVPIEVDKTIAFTQGVYATLRLKGVTGLTQIQLDDDGKMPEALPPGDNPVLRIPLVPSVTDKLLNSGEDLLKKADHIMQRLSALLSTENEQNIGGILINLKSLSDKLGNLQKGVDKALADVPLLSTQAKKTLRHINALSTDASKTLSNINALTKDLQGLTQEVQALSNKAGHLLDKGKSSGELVTQSTLPKLNKLLTDLHSTTQQVKRVATMLENNPQELLLGTDQNDVGPGEPNYKDVP